MRYFYISVALIAAYIVVSKLFTEYCTTEYHELVILQL